MKLPEPLFALINPIMGLLLRSPIHRFWSDSLMLITFTGRNSGKQFTTPVRYVKDGDSILCFTSAENQWWRNLRNGASAQLRVAGESSPYTTSVIENNPSEIKKWLMFYLSQYPQDASYHDIALANDKSLIPEDLERASHEAIVVEAKPA
ncbi:MAG: nitroreductase/quinone reductase family protein [Halioglobus sp.]